MNIAICTAQVPFIYGGNEVLVDGLRDALLERGHKVAVVALPYKWYPREQLISSALAWRMIDITEANGQSIDLAICTKWPSYAVKHPNKVTWLVHQFRQIYDWYGTPLSDFTNLPDDVRTRRIVQEMDRKTLAESSGLYTISRNVASRLQRYNGLTGTPLYPPIRSGLNLQPGPYGDYILSLGRLDPAKRVGLLLDALALSDGTRAVIAGTGPTADALKQQAGRLGLSDRVRFTGFVADDEASHLYTHARAVYYAPVDEDYGYGAVEALAAARPVVTTSDAGGVLEFVENGVTGLVSPPDAASVAASLRALSGPIDTAQKLGVEGREKVAGITWDKVVDTLLSH